MDIKSQFELFDVFFSKLNTSLFPTFIIIILIFIILKNYLFNKNMLGNSNIKIQSKLSIGPNASVMIIDLKEVRLVLGVTSTSITRLYTLSSVKLDKKDNLDKSAFLKTINDNFFLRFWKNKMIFKTIIYLFILLCLYPAMCYADVSNTFNHNVLNGEQIWSLPIQMLVLITVLTFLPSIILMMTSFSRIIIVFGLLRNALGTPYSPPNQILLGLSLFLTFFIMAPVFDQIYQDAYLPYSENKIGMSMAISRGIKPLHQFMTSQTRESDLTFFSKLANISSFSNKEEIPMRVLLPSFVTSELKTAFQIGFTIFIPFLIIDLVVASVLMSLGMMMVPPSTVSLPFKLMLFILVDGWQLLITSLTHSFYH